MRLHRFYINKEMNVAKEIVIDDGKISHQIRKVLRLKEGDSFIVFNGRGSEFEVEIVSFDKDFIRIVVKKENECKKSDRQINVFLSVIRKERFEWAVEKLAELGVKSVTPILAERSERKGINIERLKAISKEASEQCGRCDLLLIYEITDLETAFKNASGEIFICDSSGGSLAEQNLKSQISNPKNLNSNLEIYKLTNLQTFNLFIGPEGGWTDSEKNMFRKSEAKFISLGDLTFRAETASIVAVAAIEANSKF